MVADIEELEKMDASKISTIIGTLMEIENCQICGLYLVREETDKKANDLQTRLCVARNLERYVGSVEAKREAKVGDRKNEA